MINIIHEIKIQKEKTLGDFYSHPDENVFLMNENEYFILYYENEDIGPFYWNGEKYQEVFQREFKSKLFGAIKPKDKFQMCYFDSLYRNILTTCIGRSGSGKSYIALSYAFEQLEKGKLNKIIIFSNPIISKGSVKLGFLPGTRINKLLETAIGNMMISKVGSKAYLEQLIEEDLLNILTIGDVRGFETPTQTFCYVTEGQNFSKYLMQLFLERQVDNSKIVIEGDPAQLDFEDFNGENSGLTKMIEVYRGEPYFGVCQLKENYRGRIARKAIELGL